jgi:hypothetical protein
LKTADGVAAWKTAGSVALHWGSLDGACCSVKPDEARELIWLVSTKVFADLLLSLVTLRLTERATLTRKVHCWNCTCWKNVRLQGIEKEAEDTNHIRQVRERERERERKGKK